MKGTKNQSLHLSTLSVLVIPRSSPLQYKTNLQIKAQFLQKKFLLLLNEHLSDITVANYLTPIKLNQITITVVYQAIMKSISFKTSGPILISNIIL